MKYVTLSGTTRRNAATQARTTRAWRLASRSSVATVMAPPRQAYATWSTTLINVLSTGSSDCLAEQQRGVTQHRNDRNQRQAIRRYKPHCAQRDEWSPVRAVQGNRVIDHGRVGEKAG